MQSLRIVSGNNWQEERIGFEPSLTGSGDKPLMSMVMLSGRKLAFSMTVFYYCFK